MSRKMQVFRSNYNELEMLAANREYNKLVKQVYAGGRYFVCTKDDELLAFKKVKLSVDEIRMFNLYKDATIDMVPYLINYFQRNIVYINCIWMANGRNLAKELGYDNDNMVDKIKEFIDNELDVGADGKYKYSERKADDCVSYCSTFGVLQALGFNVYSRILADSSSDYKVEKETINTLAVIAFMSPANLLKHPSKLVSIILEYANHMLVRNTAKFNVTMDMTKNMFADTDIKNVDKTYEFVDNITMLWAINVLKEILNSKSNLSIGINSKQLAEYEDGFRKNIEKTYKRGSYLKKLMHAKATSSEYIDNRMKGYKTRISDYACEQIILFSNYNSSKVYADKLLKYLNRDYIADMCSHTRYSLDNLYYLISKCKSLKGVILKEIGSSKALCGIKEKLVKAEKEIESLNDSISKERVKTSNFREKSKKLEGEIAEIKSTHVPKEQTSKYVEEIKGKTEEIKRLENELAEAHKNLENKTKDYSELVKQNKKLRNSIDNYIKTFGEIEDSSEEETDEFNSKLNESSAISYESKIEYLKLFKILLCGGNDSVYNVLVEKTGLDLLFVNKENSVSANAKFDIFVILTTMCSHSTIEKVSNKAINSGAEIIYFEGSNHVKLINTLYDRMYKVYGEV